MDLETLKKELDELQKRKLALETGTELRDKCSVIFALNDRIVSLIEEVYKLQVDVKEILGIQDKWDELGQPYKVLTRTSHTLDLLIGLSKLNKVCRRIDSNPNLTHSNDGQKMNLKFRRMATNKQGDLLVDDKIDAEEMPTIMQVLELLNDFESNYKQFEEVLSKRGDLPYMMYANKVRNLKPLIEKLERLQLS